MTSEDIAIEWMFAMSAKSEMPDDIDLPTPLRHALQMLYAVHYGLENDPMGAREFAARCVSAAIGAILEMEERLS